eukprot:PhM_4_TR14173/c2_g1_i1/m.47399/K18749/LSM14, RAP55, SCD6; protein LSM14
MNQTLGSRISLISKSDIRYEGFLHAINAEENTVALKNVRMFGTEGRKGDAAQEIAPGDQLYDFIIFRGADIKDLTVFEEKKAFQDPAIISSKTAGPIPKDAPAGAPSAPRRDFYDNPQIGKSAAHKPNNNNNNNNKKNVGGRGGRGGYDQSHHHQTVGRGRGAQQPVAQQGRGRGSGAQMQQTGGRGANRGGRGGYSAGATREYDYRREVPQQLGKRGGRGSAPGGRGAQNGGRGAKPAAPAATPQVADTETSEKNKKKKNKKKNRTRKETHTGQDFVVATDAAAARAELGDFDLAKCSEKEAKAPKSEVPMTASKGYDKGSSFFDSISCDVKKERPSAAELQVRKEEREHAQQLDAETFGGDFVSSHRGGRRGGRGFRRRY